MSIAADLHDEKTPVIVERIVESPKPGELASDIVEHLYTRQLAAKVIIVTEEPSVLLAMTRKHWLKQLRLVERARARTLRSSQIGALSNILAYMRRLIFVSKPPTVCPQADVFFVTPGQIDKAEFACHTIYMTCEVSAEQLAELQAKLITEGVLVRYQTRA